MMKIRAHLQVCGLFAFYLTLSSGQFFEDPKLFFKPMREDAFDVRLRGFFRTPICVRLMMNCWEVMSGGHVCDERITYQGSVCTALRNYRCTDVFQFGQHGYPYKWMQIMDEACDSTRIMATADS